MKQRKDEVIMEKLCPLKQFKPCTSDCVFYGNCEKSDSGVTVKFSPKGETGKFACEFLKVLLAAKGSGNPVDFLKSATDSDGRSLYDRLTEMGCDVELVFSRLEEFWGDVDGG